MNEKNTLYIVIPCYKEQEVLPETSKRLREKMGSLDENAREQAIRILQGLSGGSRLVGIISHVTELKEQIEQKLVVTKGKSGSKVEWK